MKKVTSAKRKEELTSLAEYKEMLEIFEGSLSAPLAWEAYVMFKDFAWFIIRVRVDWDFRNFQVEFKDSAPARTFRSRWDERNLGLLDYYFNPDFGKPDYRTLVVSWRLPPQT